MTVVLASDLRGALIPEIVDGMLPEQGVGIWWGESTAGKSFLSWGLALAISDGSPFMSHDTIQGKVVYMVSEGERGAANRKDGALIRNARTVPAATCRHTQTCYGACKCTDTEYMDDSNIVVSSNIFHLGDTAAVTGIIHGLQRIPGLRLVILDTLSGFAGASLDWPKPANDVMAAAKLIAKEAECFVLMIHHATKKGDMFRGAQVLMDASDVFARVNGPEDDNPGEIICQKMKDGKKHGPIQFEFEEVSWIANRGDKKPVSTLVAVEPENLFENFDSVLRQAPSRPRVLPRPITQPRAIPFRRPQSLRAIARKSG